MRNNIILNTDSYKFSHWKQMPPGTEFVNSYIESRGVSRDFPIQNPEIVHFGLQAFIKEYLLNPIRKEDIDEAEEYVEMHIGPKIFNRLGWIDILNRHGGFLPLKISALREGTVLNPHNLQVQIVNTDPHAFWLTSYIESPILRGIWYPSTVATLSRETKKIIKEFLDATCDDYSSVLPFRLHDFGYRGASSHETAMLGGMAHLVNFMGTDTVPALIGANKFYGEKMAGYSIPAAEHSTITSWGVDGETDAYENMLRQFGTGLVAVVSDSYDLYNAVANIWGGTLKETVQTMGGTLVIRPDSGDPVTVVSNVFDILEEKFGFTLNQKGFKVLPNYVRVIQGDGVNPVSIREILQALKDKGWSAENIAFGMGGALLQNVNRDSLKYAMKASAVCINGEWHDVFKDPKTDPGKASKRGIQGVYRVDGKLMTFPVNLAPNIKNELVCFYEDGMLHNETNFGEVRDLAKV